MLRIPGSFNAKISEDLRRVELLRSWDGIRPKVSRDVLFDFYLDLCDKKMKELDDMRDNDGTNGRYHRRHHNCRYFKK